MLPFSDANIMSTALTYWRSCALHSTLQCGRFPQISRIMKEREENWRCSSFASESLQRILVALLDFLRATQ